MKPRLLVLIAALLALGFASVSNAAPLQQQAVPYIAYAGPDHNIWIIGTDGTHRTQLTQDQLSDNPEWTVNGSQILYQTLRDGKTAETSLGSISLNQIYSMSPNAGTQKLLSDGSSDDKYPDLVGNSDRFVLIRMNNYRVADGKLLYDTQIGSMSVNGGDYRIITQFNSDDSTHYDLYPARQNANSSKIVFTRRVVGTPTELMILDTGTGVSSEINPQIDNGQGDVEYLWPNFTPSGDIVVLRRTANFGADQVSLVQFNTTGANAKTLLSGLNYEALAYGFDVDWSNGQVVAARSPEMPGGVRPEQLYLINLSTGVAGAPLDSGHAPAISTSYAPATATPTVTNTPTDTPIPTATSTVTAPPATAVAPTGVASTAVPGTPVPATPASTGPRITTADPAFYSVWERTDRPVLDGQAQRSWTWGPAALASRQEPNGVTDRLVQYFDKARMELNPAVGGQPVYVTNGLLVVELLSGKMQIGPTSYETRDPATLAIGGDGTSNPAPSYAAMAKVSSLQGENQAKSRVGQAVTDKLNTDGSVGSTGVTSAVRYAQFVPETGHNIPDVFWTFLNAKGNVFQNGRYEEATVLDWIFTVGYPLSEPYWTKIAINGQNTDVLVQAYQRQLLTYIPSYDAPWRVQFANAGQIYYQWRYGEKP